MQTNRPQIIARVDRVEEGTWILLRDRVEEGLRSVIADNTNKHGMGSSQSGVAWAGMVLENG